MHVTEQPRLPTARNNFPNDARGQQRSAPAPLPTPASALATNTAAASPRSQPDTLLFSLPRSLLLTTSTSRLPSLLPADSDWSGLSGWTPLILILMYESLRPAADAKDNWTAYLDLLPTSFDSLMFWSKKELKLLEGSMVLGKIGRDEAEEEFNEVVKPFVEMYPDVFGPAKGYTLSAFHRMGSLILSRSFHVESGEEKDEDGEDSDDEEEEEEREDVADVAMVPMADLLNAKSGADNVSLHTFGPPSARMIADWFSCGRTRRRGCSTSRKRST